jgi:hypothetical protein
LVDDLHGLAHIRMPQKFETLNSILRPQRLASLYF